MTTETATPTISVDQSTYRASEQLPRVGLHVLIDSDNDGLADAEITGARNVDGVTVDMAVRSLTRTQSTGDCQDLDGAVTAAQNAVVTTTTNGYETMSVTFDHSAVPNGLSQFRWVAFGQSPEDPTAAGPWDYLTDAANPDPTVTNPGDRRCATSGLRVRMSAGVDVPAGSTFPRTVSDPSDTPTGPDGATDLRVVIWDIGASTATLTVSIDDGADTPASLGVHVLLDTNRDGLADAEVAGNRSADGVSLDMTLRLLDRALTTLDCQDLSGTTVAAQTVQSVIANGIETFSFTFETNSIPGGLAQFRWAAFGQSPAATISDGPWDYLPSATNPDPTATNPGDRRCDTGLSGVRLRIGNGIDQRTKQRDNR